MAVNPELLRAIMGGGQETMSSGVPASPIMQLGQQLSGGQQMAAADNMMYQQLPTLDAAKQRLLELQGLGYNGYVVPLGSDQYGHEIRAWKDTNVPSMNPNKPAGR